MNTQNEKNTSAIDDSLRTLTTVGFAWARHGLTIGSSAVRASATTLNAVANMLGDLSTRLATEANDNTTKDAQK